MSLKAFEIVTVVDKISLANEKSKVLVSITSKDINLKYSKDWRRREGTEHFNLGHDASVLLFDSPPGLPDQVIQIVFLQITIR